MKALTLHQPWASLMARARELFDDLAPVTERCPWCWGVGDVRGLLGPPCSVCDGRTRLRRANPSGPTTSGARGGSVTTRDPRRAFWRFVHNALIHPWFGLGLSTQGDVKR